MTLALPKVPDRVGATPFFFFAARTAGYPSIPPRPTADHLSHRSTPCLLSPFSPRRPLFNFDEKGPVGGPLLVQEDLQAQASHRPPLRRAQAPAHTGLRRVRWVLVKRSPFVPGALKRVDEAREGLRR